MATARVVGRVSVRVMPDTSRFKKDLQKSLERLERVLEVKIPTALNTKGLNEDAVRAKRRLEQVLGEVDTRVNIDTARGEVTIDRLARDRTATVHAQVDRSSLARARAALDKVLSSVGKTARRGLVFGTVAAGVSTLGAAAAASVVPLLQLTAALAPAAGALAGLPGAIALAQAGLVTLKVALSGVGDAFKAALEGDVAKFAEALEKLSPAARSVAKEFKAVVPQLNAIKAVTQEAFFAPLRGQITATAKALAGPLRASMAAVAAELGKGAREVARFAREGRTVVALQTIFRATRTSIANITPALQPLLAGLRDLAAVGATFLASLTPAVASAAARLGEFLSKAVESGRALEWMQGALQVFRQLGEIASNVGGILRSVFNAASASGGNLLGTFGSLTGSLNAFLKSAQGAQALRSIFQGLSAIGAALSPVLGALVTGIGQIAPAVGRIAQAVGPVLTRAIEALAPALAKLEPGITALVDGLGGAIDAIGPALPAVASAISKIAQGLAPVLPALGQLIAMLAQGLADHIERMVASGALDQLVSAVIELASALGRGLLDAIVAISPHLPELVKAFSDLLIAAVPLIPPIIDLVIAITPLIPILTDVIKYITELANLVVPALVLALDFLIGQTEGVVAVTRWAWDQIYGFVRDRIDQAKRQIDWFRGLPAMFSRWFQGARDAATRKLSDLLATVRGLPGRIKSALGNLGSLLYNAGRTVVQGLINGIVSMLGALAGTASRVAGTIARHLPGSPVKDGPLRVLNNGYAGGQIAAMIADGMAQGETLIARASSGLASAAVLSPVAAAAAGNGGVGAASDHESLGDAIVRAFGRAGITIKVNERVLAEIVSRENGRITQQRRRSG